MKGGDGRQIWDGWKKGEDWSCPKFISSQIKAFIKITFFCPAISQSIPGFLSVIKCFGKVLSDKKFTIGEGGGLPRNLP